MPLASSLATASAPAWVGRVDALNAQGVALRRAGQAQAACAAYRQALALCPETEPARAVLWRHLALALGDLGDWPGACEAAQHAATLAMQTPASGAASSPIVPAGAAPLTQNPAPGFAQKVRLDWARALACSGHPERAREQYQLALRAGPEGPGLPTARYSLALLDLLEGDWVSGWAGLEARWQHSLAQGRRPDMQRPWWQGEPLGQGASLLVMDEQGLGDTLQFVRLLPLLRQRLPQTPLHLLCRQNLLRLLKPWAQRWGVQLHHWDENWQALISHQVMLLSLPHCLGLRQPQLRALTAQFTPGYLSVASGPPLRLPSGGPLRVGLVWRGNPDYALRHARDLPLSALASLCTTPGVQWLNLQMGGAPEWAQTEGLPPVHDASAHWQDLADTAHTLCHALDLVLTVDTAMAHLAGALGVPVWLLNRHDSDWRWGNSGQDSVWYPSMRIFRQSRPRDWSAPLQEVQHALQALLQHAHHP